IGRHEQLGARARKTPEYSTQQGTYDTSHYMIALHGFFYAAFQVFTLIPRIVACSRFLEK
ncbi:MAG: hypothetical protein RR672_13440, partial [Raoultibacter sp.]